MRFNRWAAYVGSILLALFILKMQVWHPVLYPVPRNAAFLGSMNPDLPIVIGEGQVFMEMNQYENAELLSRLFFLKDQQASMQLRHTNIFQDFEAPDVLKGQVFLSLLMSRRMQALSASTNNSCCSPARRSGFSLSY